MCEVWYRGTYHSMDAVNGSRAKPALQVVTCRSVVWRDGVLPAMLLLTLATLYIRRLFQNP
jgi:hypothetical protein